MRSSRAGDARLHLGEGLAAGETKAARVALHRLPFGLLEQRLELAARPLAEVGLEQASVDAHSQLAGLGDRGRGLARALEWRRVDRVDLRQRREPRGDGGGLLPSLVGEVQARRAPGRIVPVVAVWP